jgi:hypothetical protein
MNGDYEETDYERVINETIDKIKRIEIEKTEETEKEKISLAISDFFDRIKETYIVQTFLKLDNKLKTRFEHIKTEIDTSIKIKEKVTRQIISEKDREDVVEKIFSKQREQIENEYKKDKIQIYNSILLFLAKILDNEIQIKYNSDKTKVETDTINKLDELIKSKINFESIIKMEEENEKENEAEKNFLPSAPIGPKPIKPPAPRIQLIKSIMPSGESIMPSGESIMPSGESIMPNGKLKKSSSKSPSRLRNITSKFSSNQSLSRKYKRLPSIGKGGKRTRKHNTKRKKNQKKSKQ